MKIDNLLLYDYLALNELVSASKLNEFYKKAQDEKIQLSRLLVDEKIFSQPQMLKIMATALGWKFVDLAQVKISNDILSLLPRKLANKFLAIVFEKNDELIKVAICNLEKDEIENFLKRKNTLKIEFYLADKKLIKNALSNYIQKVDLLNEKENLKAETRDQRREKKQFAVKAVNEIVLRAVSDLASEIQIEGKLGKIVVNYRIENELVEKMLLPESIFDDISEIIKSLAKIDLGIENAFQNGSFSLKRNNVETFFQVSVIPELFSERIIIRLDDNANDNLSLEKIGLAKKDVEKVYKVLQKNKGLTILVSPSGSGKTTTFYTVLGLLNSPDKNIATIEDPVEKRLNRINQSKVDFQNDLTFKTGLLSILNQDPDIIGLGEILDEGSLELTLSSAGEKLVLATMYGNSVLETIENIFVLGADLVLVAENLKLIMAQKLARKLCIHCREKYFLTESELSSLRKKYDLFRLRNIVAKRNNFDGKIDFLKIPFYRSKGCEKCGKTGYFGEIGIFEILRLSDPVKRMIAKKENLFKIRDLILKDNFETIKEDAFCKVVQGIIDFAELEKF